MVFLSLTEPKGKFSPKCARTKGGAGNVSQGLEQQTSLPKGEE